MNRLAKGLLIVTTNLDWQIADDSPNSPNFPTSCMVANRVETGSGHPGHPGHILSGSSGSDPVYKLSGSDLDSTLNHVR